MKKLPLLPLLILFLIFSCNSKETSKIDEQTKEIISDHVELEEAKAITRKLLEGTHRVENEELTRVEFESISRPLQKQLNLLIMALDEKELEELEKYKTELLVQTAKGGAKAVKTLN